MISRNCEIIPICLCNGKKSLRFTLGIANEIGIRIMKISQQKSTYFQNRKMDSSKKLWRRCCFRQYGYLIMNLPRQERRFDIDDDGK